MRKILIGGVVALVALLVASAAPSDPSKPATVQSIVVQSIKVRPFPVLPEIEPLAKKLLRADRDVAQRQLRSSTNVVAFFEHQKWRWMRAPRQEKCWQVPWQRTCTIARHSYRLHLTLAVVAKSKLWYDLPHTTDWKTAAKIAQRAYPGTYAWLMSCSGTEGGHGAWVPNRDGAPPGGWMQMYQSTYWRMWGLGSYDGAIDDLAERGFSWPRSAASWYSPLGQALASGWGYTHGRRGEWHSSGCYIN